MTLFIKIKFIFISIAAVLFERCFKFLQIINETSPKLIDLILFLLTFNEIFPWINKTLSRLCVVLNFINMNLVNLNPLESGDSFLRNFKQQKELVLELWSHWVVKVFFCYDKLADWNNLEYFMSLLPKLSQLFCLHLWAEVKKSQLIEMWFTLANKIKMPW